MAAGGALLFAIAGVFSYLFLAPAQGETQTGVCVLVVDRTGSSINKKTRESYLQQATDTIAGCREQRTQMLVYSFDNRDAKLQPADDQQPYALFRPATRRESTGETLLTETMDAVTGAVKSVFKSSGPEADGRGFGHGSDILKALELAAVSLQSQAAADGVDDRYLVFMTDGLQTGPFGWRRLFPDRSATVDAAVTRTRREGLLPDLQGASVSFVGTNGGVASSRNRVPAWAEAKIEAYWTELVEAGGGSMCIYTVESPTLPVVC